LNRLAHPVIVERSRDIAAITKTIEAVLAMSPETNLLEVTACEQSSSRCTH